MDENITGLLCPARDEKGLRDALARMLDTSKEDRAAMGIAGREKMQRQFDKTAVVNETMGAIFR